MNFLRLGPLVRSALVAATLFTAAYPVAAQPAPEADSLNSIRGDGAAVERSAVVAVLNEYLKVVDARDPTAIARALHPNAVLSSITPTGAVAALTQDAWWERVSRIPASGGTRSSRIVLVDVEGVSAVARVDITSAQGARSTDHFTLLKTKDGWRVINKTLSVPL